MRSGEFTMDEIHDAIELARRARGHRGSVRGRARRDADQLDRMRRAERRDGPAGPPLRRRLLLAVRGVQPRLPRPPARGGREPRPGARAGADRRASLRLAERPRPGPGRASGVPRDPGDRPGPPPRPDRGDRARARARPRRGAGARARAGRPPEPGDRAGEPATCWSGSRARR